MSLRPGFWIRLLAAAPLLLCLAPILAPAHKGQGQDLGNLISPGKLAKAHSKFEGLDNCQKCHEPGKKVTAEKCLACHQPIAERIAAKKGVHRDVKGDCVTCHVEHEGVDAQLRPFDPKKFDHSKETGFALDGRHAPLAGKCESCHKVRSFLAAQPACASCHADVHKGRLGPDCASCHTTSAAFKDAAKSFDHSKAAFPLTGAHATVKCAACHKTPDYRVAKFGACNDCHKDPHQKPLGVCASCHTSDSFKTTRRIEHDKTGFPLLGKHATVPCATCHVKPPTQVRLKAGKCSDCHQDPHKGVFKGADCASCHNESGYTKVSPFDHAVRTGYALEGGHATVPCVSCHKGAVVPAGTTLSKSVVDFRGAKKDCASCHRDVHQGELGGKCESCHTVKSFKVASFQHPKFPEFFSAKHVAAPCEKCHKAPEPAAGGAPPARLFKGVSTACATCHKDPHLGQMGATCQTCHTLQDWKIPAYKHQGKDMAAFFAGKHGTLPCADCHKEKTGAFPAGTGTAIVFKGTSSQCASCHKDAHNGTLGTKCESCHNLKIWKNASRAFHKDTIFPLEGRHLSTPCGACHLNGVIKGTPNRCFDCHWIRHRDDKYETRLGNECGNCHRPTSWTAVVWNHAQATGFPLAGVHATLQCQTCHRGNVFTGLSPQCYACHQKDYEGTRSPNHVIAGFPTTCETCHKASDAAWTGTFNHATTFPLVGVHTAQPCGACHKNNVYHGTARDCYGCHKTNYDQTTNPKHVTAGFPTTCETCHKATDATWNQGVFNHATAFALVGVHATQPCAACHKNSVYRGTARDCYGCHKPNYDQTTNPKHVTAGFPTACETCHKATDASWNQGVFNHATAFALVGVHTAQPCGACHKNGVYRGTARDCYGCHKPNYDQTTNPKHVAAGFPTTCDTCHKATDANWNQSSFNHATTFPLVGVHTAQPCGACHKNNVYRGTARDCYGCHKAKYDLTTNPKHVAAGFPTTCETCHKATDASWNQGVFNHATAFPLVGVHTAQPCGACHKNNVYRGTARDCYGCHKAKYDLTTNPKHVAAGFPTTCETCHKATDASWNQGVFNHATVFPLVGVHTAQPCAACHKNNVYRGTARDCYGCHKPNYDQTTNPKHVSAGFPTTCETCHKATDASWNQGVFNHSSFFPLVGVHVTQPCAACHPNNRFAGTPTTCAGCHLAKYNATTNPNHIAAGFPTTCNTCHRPTDTSWNQGTFNHTWFPITSGAHTGLQCAQCHTAPSNFAVFSCTTGGCHPQSQTNSKHQGVSGYAYSSPACYSCHPNGRAGNSTTPLRRRG
jgi:hypothetical protein